MSLYNKRNGIILNHNFCNSCSCEFTIIEHGVSERGDVHRDYLELHACPLCGKKNTPRLSYIDGRFNAVLKGTDILESLILKKEILDREVIRVKENLLKDKKYREEEKGKKGKRFFENVKIMVATTNPYQKDYVFLEESLHNLAESMHGTVILNNFKGSEVIGRGTYAEVINGSLFITCFIKRDFISIAKTQYIVPGYTIINIQSNKYCAELVSLGLVENPSDLNLTSIQKTLGI